MSLTIGDIGFVQYNADGTDNFAFVALVDIATGETIKFTDNGWLGNDSGFRTGEGVITWTAPAGGVTAGTVVTIDVTPTTSSGSVVETGSLNFSGSGDQIIAYQEIGGNLTPIAALNNEESATFQADATSSNTSALPAGLVEGASAVALSEQDNAVYSGPTSGDRATLLTALNSAANWTGSDSTNQTFSATFNVLSTDITVPTLVSITRQAPAANPTGDDTLVFLATFSEDVQNVDASDFQAVGTSANVSSVTSVTASTYSITLSGGNLATLNGSVGLNLAVGQTIQDLVGNALPSVEPTTDESFNLVNIPDSIGNMTPLAVGLTDVVFTLAQTIQFQQFNSDRTFPGLAIALETEIGGLNIASLFDESYYLNHNPDVANAVRQGIFAYGFQHFLAYGIREGRNPASWFDEADYLASYADVNAAIEQGQVASGIEHYLTIGHRENRNPSRWFDARDYLLKNPDVNASVTGGSGFVSAFEHYLEAGSREGRLSRLLFEEAFYLFRNPDVAAAVNDGVFENGLEHFARYGQSEGRDPSPFFNQSTYLTRYSDVAAAVTAGAFASAFEHFVTYGRAEGRLAI